MEYQEELYGGPVTLMNYEYREKLRSLVHNWVDLVFIGIGIGVAVIELSKEE